MFTTISEVRQLQVQYRIIFNSTVLFLSIRFTRIGRKILVPSHQDLIRLLLQGQILASLARVQQ
jgi:hypothetical protein